jgi:ATP-dependent helicase HrpA
VTTKAEFLRHNLELVAEIRELEARQRRRDLLASDDVLAAFYSDRIPADVADVRDLERWRRGSERQNPHLLFMSRDDVLMPDGARAGHDGFPSTLVLHDVEFRLRYSFAPGALDDGVSLQVPLGLLAHVRQEPLDWLVPGLLGPRCEALVRALPKALRRPLAPLPEKIDAILPALLRADTYRHGRLERVLGERLEALFDVRIALDAWNLEAVDPHLRMNVQVRDNKGALVDQDRDAGALIARLEAKVTQRIETRGVKESLEAHNLKQFPAVEVAAQRVLDDGDGRLIVYPALVDRGASVSLVMAPSAAEQRRLSRDGYSRMVLLSESKTARFPAEAGAQRTRSGAAVRSARLCRHAHRRVAAGVGLVLFLRWPRSAAFDHGIRRACGAASRRMAGYLRHVAMPREGDPRGQVRRGARAFGSEIAGLRRTGARDECSAGAARARGIFWIAFRCDISAKCRAISRRSRTGLEGLQGRIQKDAQTSGEIVAFEARLARIVARLGARPDLEDARFMIEEYRVAVFAQRLRTKGKVSAKRIESVLVPLEEEAGVR